MGAKALIATYLVLGLTFIGLAAWTLQTPAPAEARPFTLMGKSSWYGGPCDGADNNIPAFMAGDRNYTPGIALLRRDTARKAFLLTLIRTGRRIVVRHTDYGPAAWTGKLVDINYTAVQGLGYSGCGYDYPSGARVRLTMLTTKAQIRSWSKRTKTKLDDTRIAARL